MRSYKENWDDFAQPVAQMFRNIGYSIQDSIEDMRDGNFSLRDNFLMKAALVIALIFVVYLVFVKSNSADDSAKGQQGLSKYYGYYEYEAANICLDESTDNNSFYVYVSFEPSASWWAPMHGNVPLDGEPHFLFYADSPSSAQNVVAEKDLISGAISLEPMDNGSLHMVLYKDTNDDDPYNVELVPST